MMDRYVRAVLWAVIVVQAMLAVAFAFEVEPAIGLWPFPGRTPLANIFIGSIFAAAVASTTWCLAIRSDRAIAGTRGRVGPGRSTDTATDRGAPAATAAA